MYFTCSSDKPRLDRSDASAIPRTVAAAGFTWGKEEAAIAPTRTALRANITLKYIDLI